MDILKEKYPRHLIFFKKKSNIVKNIVLFLKKKEIITSNCFPTLYRSRYDITLVTLGLLKKKGSAEPVC